MSVVDGQSGSKKDNQNFPQPELQELQTRIAWSQGDEVEIFSNTFQQWHLGKVVRIINDDEGEWLDCQYSPSKREVMSKQVQRFSTDVRPVTPVPRPERPVVAADARPLVAAENKSPEFTLALIKPNAFPVGWLVIDRFIIQNGFAVAAKKQVVLTRTRAEAFFAEQKDEDGFEELIEFMISYPIYALVLYKVDAVKAWLDIMGPADVEKARAEAPHSVRARVGSSNLRNAVYGSASADAAIRDMTFFFYRHEQTLALIKPDAVAAGKAREIIAQIESDGFTVVERAQLTLTKERAEEFYASYKSKGFYERLVAFMSSGAVVALKLERAHAITMWQDSEWRKRYACHASDSVQSAARELEFFFPQEETLLIVKPQAMQSGTAAVLHSIIADGFTLIESCMWKPRKEQVQEFLGEHKERCSEFHGTSIAHKLRRANAIARLRRLMETNQQTIKDAAYWSDSAESAKRELAFIFEDAQYRLRSTRQYTLALIKPDAVADGKVTEIVNRIKYEGFVVREQKQLKLSKQRAEAFYSEHKGRNFFDELITFMTSGELLALKLEREDAVNGWYDVMGPADLEVAKKEKPQSVRALFATSKIKNATHGSNSVQSAQRELDFFFGNE